MHATKKNVVIIIHRRSPVILNQYQITKYDKMLVAEDINKNILLEANPSSVLSFMCDSGYIQHVNVPAHIN